jgi:hypothetical protein
MVRLVVTTCAAALIAACGGDMTETTATTIQAFPEVVEVMVAVGENGSYRFDATMSSPYDSDDRYADAWRVVDEDGTVYGIRELTHPHANEQPFTRSLSGVEIPADVSTVIVEGRDSINGWGGETVEVMLP